MTQAPEWKLVPVEPTEAMHDAAVLAYQAWHAAEVPNSEFTHNDVWRAMIAAAPHTAAPAADRAVSELIDAAEITEAWGQTSFDDYAPGSDIFHAGARWMEDRLAAPRADRAELAAEAKRLLKAIPAGALRPTLDRLVEPIIAAIDALARSTDAPSEPSIGFSPMWLAPIDGTPVLLYLPTTGDKFAVGQWHGDAWGDDEGNYYTHGPAGWMGLHVLERIALATPPAATTSTETPVSTPCASGEARVLFAPWSYRWTDLELQEVYQRATALAASQTPAVPATSESAGEWSRVPTEILGRFPEINPSNYDHDDACAVNAWGVELVLAAKALPPDRTPTAGNTEDARSMGAKAGHVFQSPLDGRTIDTRSMGAVPAEVTAWVKAEGERIAAVNAFNAANEAAKQHGFGEVDLNPQFQRITAAEKAARSLIAPMYAALTQAASTGGAAS